MSTLSEFTYPYNPNGVLTECNITGESHTITPSADRNYNWFVPYAAPFFGFSVVVRHVASGKTLQRGVDYNFGLEYHVFNTQVTLRQVYGAIVLIDTALTGQFEIDYMTIGGQYAIDESKALSLLANAQLDPRQTYWENVTDIPSQFPVTQHLHNVSDVTGMADVVVAIQALQAAFTNSGGKWWQALAEHLTDYNDPHHTLEMIPGGGGTAIPKATQQQAIEGTDNTAYMTVLRVAQWYSANKQPDITAIQNAITAIQAWTKADIGLADVVNAAQAVEADYDSSTNPTLYVNNALLKYAIDKAFSNFDTSVFVTHDSLATTLTTRFADITSYPATSSVADILTQGRTDRLVTAAGVKNSVLGYNFASFLGICTTTAQRNAYLAQTTVTEEMVDIATGEAYVYDVDNNQWVLDTSVTLTGLILNGRTYYNRVSGIGYLCTDDAASVTAITTKSPGSTISTAVPPTDTTGYAEGHVWYQIN